MALGKDTATLPNHTICAEGLHFSAFHLIMLIVTHGGILAKESTTTLPPGCHKENTVKHMNSTELHAPKN